MRALAGASQWETGTILGTWLWHMACFRTCQPRREGVLLAATE
jgi:hypothetical protein